MSDRAIYAPGDRVSLATLEREDVPTLHRWLNDPRVLATLIQLRPFDLAAENQWFDGLDRKPIGCRSPSVRQARRRPSK